MKYKAPHPNPGGVGGGALRLKNQHFQGAGRASEDDVAYTLLVSMCVPEETEEGELAYLVGCTLHV